MVEPDSEPTGEATIDGMFRISGRGWALVFLMEPEAFTGKIFSNGIVQSDRGTAPYGSLEYADKLDDPRTWLGIIVSDEAKPLFDAGQTVRFYKRSESDKG